MNKISKKIFIIIMLVLAIVSLVACGKSEEESREQQDVNYMDATETLSMQLWLKQKESEPELCKQLADTGLFYDPNTDSLVKDKPTVGYGQGTSKDGGVSWGYYSGVKDGEAVISNYDNSFDYTNCYLHVQYDESADVYYMNWEAVE